MLNDEKISELKALLEKEKAVLETELADIGRLDTINKDDWHGTAGEVSTETADAQVLADSFEESMANDAVVSELEVRYKNVNDALKRIANGTYGICENDNKPIPIERLEANPAATTCLEHEN